MDFPNDSDVRKESSLEFDEAAPSQPECKQSSSPRSAARQHSERPARITLSQEAKRRAARRGNWAAMPFTAICLLGVFSTGEFRLLLVFIPLMLLVSFSTWFWFMRVERHAVQEALDQEAMLQEARQQARAMHRSMESD